MRRAPAPSHQSEATDTGHSTLPGELTDLYGDPGGHRGQDLSDSIWPSHDRPDTPDAAERVMALPTVGHIGRYQLKYHLGKGGIGTVWAAYDPLLSRLVAIKTVPIDLPMGDARRASPDFLGEARAAANLSHKHIVTVHDAGLSPEGAYIAMELLHGRDLAQMLRLGWRPSPIEAALIVRRVADALAYAHSRGVIHRDIKPGNIFMTGPSKPLVLDFGTASVAYRSELPGQPVFGSPYYAAPEQIQGNPTDARTDVYALGVMFYELLCGEKAFGGRSLEEITAAVQKGHPRPLEQIDPSLPSELIAIATRAMARSPQQRFAGAAQMSSELRAWLADHPDGETSMRLDRFSRGPAGRLASGLRRIAPMLLTGGVAAGITVVLMNLLQKH